MTPDRQDAVTAAVQRLAERATDARQHVGVDVTELLEEVSTSTWVARMPVPWDHRPSEWHDPQRRHLEEPFVGPLLPGQARPPRRLVDTSEGKWPTSARHETTAPGLLTQLRDQVNAVLNVPSDGVNVRSAPDSRPPADVMDFLSIVTEIEAGALDLWQRARTDLGMRPSLLLVNDELGVYTADPSPEKALTDLAQLVHSVGDALAVRIGREIRSWVSAAKVTLSYTAPVVTLEQRCWYCQTGALKVRSDASSDLWCDNDEWHDQHDDVPRRWPRASWLMMLTESEGAD